MSPRIFALSLFLVVALPLSAQVEQAVTVGTGAFGQPRDAVWTEV